MIQKYPIGVTFLLFIFLLSACEKENFMKPYYETLLSCLGEGHPYIQKASEHRFELSDDAKIFEEAGDSFIPNIAFSKESNEFCSTVKIEKSWWNALPEEYTEKEEERKHPRKRDVAKYLFYVCFSHYITGQLPWETTEDEDALRLINELNKISNKCGFDVVPLNENFIDFIEDARL